MRSLSRNAAIWAGIGLSLLITACGGGTGTPVSTSYVLTVNSTNPASGVPISVGNSLNNVITTGTTSFTETYDSGTTVTLTAPATTAGNSFSSWTGCTSASTKTCTVTLNSNTTVTANFATPVKTTPTMTLTPSSSSITATQALTVTAAVSGASGSATPTGTVVLTSGSYTSATATLSAGSATISVAAGALATGADTLTVTYTPDTASAATYNSASANTSVTVTVPVTYLLTVNSASPSSGVAIVVSPADNSSAGNGTTSFTRTYNAATRITLSAPQTSDGYSFVSWTGCTSGVTLTCSVTLSSNTTVTATYSEPSITSVSVTPNPATATIGTQLQFTATVAGTGSFSKGVTWTLAAPSGSSLSPGTLTSTGLYTTPYPAPATVTVTATSTEDTTKSGSVTVTLAAPATAAGPALSVDAGNQTHAISPDIYGLNAYYLDTASATTANTSIARWGGDDISRYNFQTNTTNSASDWYFENFTGAGNMWGGGSFTGLLSTAHSIGSKTLGTAPVLGWVANSTVGACSFTQAAYPGQQSYNGTCGDGIDPDGTNRCTNSGGCDIYGSDTIAAITSLSKPAPTPPTASAATLSWAQATWAGSWVNSLLTNSSFGNAASGKGVAIWDLDNEPSWWDAVHRDVHPDPFTYDEVTNGGIGTALAIKTVDPTAEVSGPVMDYWWDYFYSKKDVESGWSAGPCYQPFSNPVDRTAHGGTPFIEYYLQQMAAAETTYGKRLLDYVELPTYFAADGAGLTVAGDTQTQQARLNSTRVFWDSTYTDPNYPQPNYTTDSNYTSSCNPPAQAPQLITMMKNWVAKDYPNTKLAIDEYNFGGLESINGAVTQADILGIFGREGLDLGALWPTDAYTNQGPGDLAFAIYRNYDGKNSTFGDTALNSTSATQGALSVYGALRSSDNAVTVVVINKTYGSLTATLSLANLTGNSGTAQAYLLSSANLNAIVAQPTVTVTPPPTGSTTSAITNYNFPAQSITLFVVPR